jgi:hypothetical protein
MSLLTTASPFTSGPIEKLSSRPKKRKVQSQTQSPQQENNIQVNPRESFQSQIEKQEAFSNKVNEILSNMSAVKTQNDGDHLQNFTPIKPPESARDTDTTKPGKQTFQNPFRALAEEDDANKKEPFTAMDQAGRQGFRTGNDLRQPMISDYAQSYGGNMSEMMKNFMEATPTNVAPGVATTIPTSGGNASPGMSQDKVLEKLNYMIHLLEEQKHEQTHHVTEEFLLYTFLGVFIIYIVDSFSRAGKYIR